MHPRNQLIVASLVMLFTSSAISRESDYFIDNSKVVPLARFLEAEPLNKSAPITRALLLKLGEKSTDVVDVVGPSMFSSLLDKKAPFQSELLAQFVIGSAAYQIENPTKKGELVSQQIAGMRSVLKAYQSYQTKNPQVSIPELDRFSRHESEGTLVEFMSH